jgi:hypothetical protein
MDLLIPAGPGALFRLRRSPHERVFRFTGGLSRFHRVMLRRAARSPKSPHVP